jgi:4-hydroxy-tetrahydrodipicolinate synthase
MSSPRFGRVLTAMVTPFDAQGAINFDVAGQVAKFLAANGSDGLIVAGSTGEGPTLNDDEKLQLFSHVAAEVTIPVIAGSTFANTQQSVSLTKRLTSSGVAGVLATTPAYSRPNQMGIKAHLAAVADATELPVMLYDIPSRTGRKIAGETTIALVSEHANIVALKDASGDLETARHVKQTLGDQLDLYSGDDALLLPFLAEGAVGIVSVASHWAGPEFQSIIAAFGAGDLATAQEITERLAPSCVFEGSEAYPNPMPSKAMMRAMGIPVGECRLPHAPSDATLDAQAASLLEQVRSSRG